MRIKTRNTNDFESLTSCLLGHPVENIYMQDTPAHFMFIGTPCREYFRILLLISCLLGHPVENIYMQDTPAHFMFIGTPLQNIYMQDTPAAALLDVTNNDTSAWLKEKLRSVRENMNNTFFFLDTGNTFHTPHFFKFKEHTRFILILQDFFFTHKTCLSEFMIKRN